MLMAGICHNHPNIETKLSCSRCAVSVCHQCFVHAPVGIRCLDCAIIAKMPMFTVTVPTYLRVLLFVNVISIFLGLSFGLLFSFLYTLQIIFIASIIAFGYVIGEITSFISGKKVSPGLKIIAATSFGVFYLSSGIYNSLVFLVTVGNPFILVTFLIAIYVSGGRVK